MLFQRSQSDLYDCFLFRSYSPEFATIHVHVAPLEYGCCLLMYLLVPFPGNTGEKSAKHIADSLAIYSASLARPILVSSEKRLT